MIAGILVYFALLIGIALYSQNRSKLSGDRALDYFLGGRKLGIIPLAMTTAATYISASSFIGGPGVVYNRGLSWVFLAAVQYPVSLLMMGVLGKQLQQLGHKHKLYDLADYIQLRYRSRLYSKFCAVLIAVVLLLGLMIAIMGGSRLLQGALGPLQGGEGLSYRNALFIFSLALAIYTLLGGFRAVVLTDILQGAWMLLTGFILLFFLWHKAGGAAGLTRFAAENPDLFRADSGGAQPLSYTINFTILVGFGMIVQPISFSRLLAFGKGKSLRKSILISMAVIGMLTFLPHFIGFLGRIVLPGLDQPDQLMGRISQLFRVPQSGYGIWGRIFSGMLVSAMLAAIMSTADSTLNTLGLTIYRHLLPRRVSSYSRRDKEGKDGERSHFLLSRLLAGAAIVLVALLALEPPKLLVVLNLYTLGTTQVALLWPVVLGMFTRRPDVRAALSSSLAGLMSYFLLNRLYPNFGGAALLPYCLLIGIVVYFGVAFYTAKCVVNHAAGGTERSSKAKS
ncbi:hypothetical protein P0082_00765 [Candidatus Haliotispira prima]|uniref:Sodium/pantothenate symporter n=1 Tax=Candidatus Haliotispira prima TaxID=3034016 RepID=A0ABY8MHC1_9SPIO|nr:hypothetical protein P0082_00765 [Candidatus Haliotispira prima]